MTSKHTLDTKSAFDMLRPTTFAVVTISAEIIRDVDMRSTIHRISQSSSAAYIADQRYATSPQPLYRIPVMDEYQLQALYFEIARICKSMVYRKAKNLYQKRALCEFIQLNERHLKDAYTYFYDRWTWETNSDNDREAFLCIEIVMNK